MIALNGRLFTAQERFRFATRYVDPAFGFALGYNYLFKYFVQTTKQRRRCRRGGSVLDAFCSHRSLDG